MGIVNTYVPKKKTVAPELVTVVFKESKKIIQNYINIGV
jgi:hypothetical protein